MPGAGTVELQPHNLMHMWVGDLSYPNIEDIGTYYASGYDPIFYTHHAYIDRLWDIWCNIGSGDSRRHTDLTDPDLLNSSFLFYDEEARLVRITVRDMLDIEKLRS
ncbi:hypothetical protein E2562_027494 [Oryza meyeriana var. granulata]|uniref:Tyrosinase copper-binding domain-containing protein n=1 Tax=Oryza meyeriana var. granulata TaxID=110450 RepID=A0A6G1E4S6_9ORYZ|nr:hypothetical protein E2562_027494 [Oryza meyeriana var. granulata]